MKAKISIITFLLMFTTSGLYAVPQDRTFTASGHILPGEEWNNVYIYNDGTIVNMLGADLDSIGTYDASILNVTGGRVNTLGSREFSTINVSGGEVYGLQARDNSIVNFSGDAKAQNLGAGSDFGTINMVGGITNRLGAGDSGTINLYGGVIKEHLGASGEAVVNVYGYGFDYDSTAGSIDGGQLTGFWLDGTSFTIDLYGTETYSHINLIPEPGTILLLGLGGLAITHKAASMSA